jgi:DNA transposition AAA+ family ATPase
MNELTLQEKDTIREALQAYCSKYSSRNKASSSLKGISAGTVSTILNGKYDNISDEMFRNIASQTGVGKASDWQMVETGAFRDMRVAMCDAQEFRNVTWVVGDAGSGKSAFARQYAQEHRETFYVTCTENMSRDVFIRDVARNIGLRCEGYTLHELWDRITGELIQMESPLMIFDEADKLKDPVFRYFISFYNMVEEKCGIIFLSTNHIRRRVETGLRYNKTGYNEIYSRIGRKFFEVEPTTADDVYAICMANGVKDEKDINKVIKDAATCNFDLRRVKKSIHRIKRLYE